MPHINYLLDENELESRLKIYKLTDTHLIKESQALNSLSSDEIELYLLGLKTGECVTFDKSIWFKVIKGSICINGHVYTQFMSDYRKYIVPPWSPVERSYSERACSHCNDIILKWFHGKTCCDIKRAYLNTKQYIRELLNLSYDEIDVELDNTFDATLINYYNDEECVTLICLLDYKSAFGRISVPSALKPRYPLKIIQNELDDIARFLLDIRGVNSPVLMLHGDSNTGKTTTVVYLINYLLNFVSNVALLDIDSGQPIVTPPGLISLTFFDTSITTPPHSLINDVKPEVQFLLGDVKVTHPMLMLQQIKRCIKIYEQSIDGEFKTPLIINTFGWTTQLGGKLLESILSIAHVTICVKLVGNVKLAYSGGFNDHAHLEDVIEKTLFMEVEDVLKGGDESKIDVGTINFDDVDELNSYKEIKIPSFAEYVNVANDLINDVMKFGISNCRFTSWANLTKKIECSVAALNLRWLRICSYMNSGYGDAIHFPQLEHEEFFDALKTPNFNNCIKNPEKFILMKQLLLITDKYSFVVTNDTVVTDLSQLSPMMNGSTIAICSGYIKDRIHNRISHKWKFVAYAYVHYFDINTYNMMISYPRNIHKTSITRKWMGRKESVLCRGGKKRRLAHRNKEQTLECVSPFINLLSSLRLTPHPPRSMRIEYGSSEIIRSGQSSSSQCTPYRRNSLLHLVGSYGAGLSAPTSRTNIKRFKNSS